MAQELIANTSAGFTRWIVRHGLLHEPFVVIDVGVQGGEAERWRVLGDHLVVHGFDPIQEVIDELRRRAAHQPNRSYHCMAAGNADEMRTFYLNTSDRYSSSFYSRAGQPREVQVRRLDALRREGTIPSADVLKIDVEGAEKDVFLGAPELVRHALAIEAETNFSISETYPGGHFFTLAELALEAHKSVFDVAFHRIPRPGFARELDERGRAMLPFCELGGPTTVNVLFCRDLAHEAADRGHSELPPLETDGYLKYLITLELYGLNDVALEVMQRFSQKLEARIDLEKATDLLADPCCRLALGRRRTFFRLFAPLWRAYRAVRSSAQATARLPQSNG
jgi:FkbM family methyltransferase